MLFRRVAAAPVSRRAGAAASLVTTSNAIITSYNRYAGTSSSNNTNEPTAMSSNAPKAGFDRFGGEASYVAPKVGEEIDFANVGARVPWPEVQRQLQLFVSNSATDTKATTRGRTFLRDFDVLSNVTSISEGLELLYYMQRLSYPPHSKLELSLVAWLSDNMPLITADHMLDVCRYALEQHAYEHWKRCVLLTDAFIPHMVSLLEGGSGSGAATSSNSRRSGGQVEIEDLILVARVLQQSREEVSSSQRKSLLPGVEYARKRPVYRVIIRRVADLLQDESDAITPEIVGNVVKHVATLDPSYEGQQLLLDSLEFLFNNASAVDAMRYLTAMAEAYAGFPQLINALVNRINEHATNAVAAKPPKTKRGQRKTTKKASITAIAANPDNHAFTEAVVDVTYITKAYLLVVKLCPDTPALANPLLETLRPAVDIIQQHLLRDRTRMLLDDSSRLLKSLSDLCDVSDIVSVEALKNDDALLRSMRAFAQQYMAAVDTSIKNGSQTVTSTTMEESGFALRIASKLMDHNLAAEIATKCEELCAVLLPDKNDQGASAVPLSMEGCLRVLQGLASAGAYPPRLVEMSVRVCMEHRSTLSSRDVATVIFVAGVCKGTNIDSEVFHQLTARLLNTAKFRRHDVLGPNDVAQLLRGLAAAGIKPDERLQAFLGEQALKYTSEFSIRDATSLLIVVHQLGLDQSSVGQRLGLEVAAAIPSMGADDLVRLASVLAELNIRDVCMLDAIGYRLRDCYGQLKAKHLTEFAMSLRELNFASMFAKCGLADLVPVMADLTPNEATYLLAFCPQATQEIIIGKYIDSVDSLHQLNPSSLITIYGSAPDDLPHIRDGALQLMKGLDAPLTVSADVGCLALCRAINSDDPYNNMLTVTAFLHPIAHKFSSTQIDVITDHLRNAIARCVPDDARRANEERDERHAKELQIAELGKENIIAPSRGARNRVLGSERFVTTSLRGSTFVVPAPFFRFYGRRICANADFFSAEVTLAMLEIYMHGKVRDDKVVKTLYRRLGKTFRPIANSPRLTRTSLETVKYFSPAWASTFLSSMKIRSSLEAKEFKHAALE